MYPGEQLWFYSAETTLKPWWQVEEAIGPGGDPAETLPLEVGEVLTAVSTDPTLLLPDDVLGQCNWILSAPAPFAARVTVGTTTDGSTFTWSSPVDVTIPAGRSPVPVPAGQANTAAMLSGSYQAIRVEALAAGVLTDCYLQIEPPQGLQVQVGETWSEWITPALVPLTAPLEVTQTSRVGTSDPAPDQLKPDDTALDAGYFDEAYARAVSATPTVGTSSVSIFQAVGTADFTILVEDVPPPEPPHPGWWRLRARVTLSILSTTALWITGSTYRRRPLELDSLVRYREWVNYEFGSGSTNAVSWQPARWVKRAAHFTDELPGGGPSPHGDSYSTDVGTVSGSEATSNNLLWPANGSSGSALGGSAFTPPPGDYTWDIDMSWESSGPPDVSWGLDAGEISQLVGQGGFRAYRGDATVFFTNPLVQNVRMPDFRYSIPVWGLSPDAINPVQPPLRQIQRDDAANGLSTRRWGGGSSRQSSNRWIGYL